MGCMSSAMATVMKIGIFVWKRDKVSSFGLCRRNVLVQDDC